MSSRPRNFRRRAGDDDDTPATDHVGESNPTTTNTKTGPSSTTSLSKPSSKPKPKKPPKLLSFADDEDTDDDHNSAATRTPFPKNPSRSAAAKPKTTTKPSSSSSSHKMTALKDRVFHSSLSIPSNVQPQAGLYTKEALLELQKNTRTLASSSSAAPVVPKPTPEPVVVLRGLLKPSKEPELSVPEEEDGAEAAAAAASDEVIPDQATIAAIRAKRERMRMSRAAAPDYIAIDGGSAGGSKGDEGGLSDEEPENLTRIALLGERDSGRPGTGVFEAVTMVAAAERGDEVVVSEEEEEIWEEEQFRKGLGKNRVDDSASVGVGGSRVAAASGSASIDRVAVGGLSLAGASQGLGLGMVSISQQGEIAKKALLDSIKKLKESHGKTVSLLNKTDENLSASLINITALEKSLSAADEKYQFMQKLRDFVSIICDFLQHKAPYIEELEDQMQQLHQKRASTIAERRAADNDDEMKVVEAEVNAAMSVFNRRGSSAGADIVVAAKSAAQVASAALREQANLPVKLDEFGRDMNLQKRMETKGRAEARHRRKARSEMKRLSSMDVDSQYQRIEGESSTDESDSESMAFNSHRDLLLETASHVFSDASEEYSQLSVVKETFEEWKRDHLSAYRDAYISLSIPSIFSPYVRLELLKWDPLREKSDFLDMNWHTLLMDYGSPKDGGGFAPDDADANLVPELVEKVALPILHHEVVQCWDMLSTKETENAVAATSLVTDYVPASSKALADLLVAVRTRLADSVANLTVPTWSPLVFQAVPNAARIAAYRFGVSVRLMRNICLWKDILSLPLLEQLALDDLLCAKILPHVRSIAPNIHDAITRTERIIASLSGVWTGPSATGNRSQNLQALVDYVMLLRSMLEKKHALVATESETQRLARRLKKMLVELNEYDKARDIARTFHLKEAL